ncbi:carboxypeptidase family protein [Tahibacter aquaticus]|jgi:hypothetical protein|uniref:Carboxypeptidase family protein n=1 Tax=Tahibacter aquaticus TaxID=520092 RepID=A0A4R6YTS0_9GAMM|nr:carboxypeptidase-like regulatory domain-containing protein [Tahibacter aquaticus]TDR41741.1 carboxypeptidase family protein [Tahibacter aquaticus]
MLSRTTFAALLLLIAAGSGTAVAQSSTIVGSVVDAVNKAPLADVVVSAANPALQAEQTVVTDSQGNYRIPQMPPGSYTLRFEADAYKTYTRSDIQLSINRTIRVNVELLPNNFQEPAGRQ